MYSKPQPEVRVAGLTEPVDFMSNSQCEVVPQTNRTKGIFKLAKTYRNVCLQISTW